MTSQPNQEEKQVIKCLRMQNFEKIIFEPDGNVPPDLLLNDQIAIEVRRLNQNQIKEDSFKGLETDDYNIKSMIGGVLSEISDKEFDHSAFISYSFKRPLPKMKLIKKAIIKVLEHHKSVISESKTYKIDDYFEIRTIPSVNRLQRQFESAVSVDSDSGGFVVGLIYENLKLVIAEKEKKTKAFKDNYREWWLAVVDTIGYGLDDMDTKQFYQLPKLSFEFDRILLVSPLDALKYRYLYE